MTGSAAQVLSVERTATPEVIKSAYRKCALKFHPDKAGADDLEAAGKVAAKVRSGRPRCSGARPASACVSVAFGRSWT